VFNFLLFLRRKEKNVPSRRKRNVTDRALDQRRRKEIAQRRDATKIAPSPSLRRKSEAAAGPDPQNDPKTSEGRRMERAERTV
jgi:hypothetical protein